MGKMICCLPKGKQKNKRKENFFLKISVRNDQMPSKPTVR